MHGGCWHEQSKLMSIVYQGEPGAYSHLACVEHYPEFRPEPCPTFAKAFAAVKGGTAQLAMIPVENSLAGRVSDIYHLLPGGGLHIIAEHFIPIRHQLLGVKGARLEDIEVVRSHAMALGQVRETLAKLGVASEVAADTAGAARRVAQLGQKSMGAVASKLAAETYGLDILSENIEDAGHNTTRFLVLSREPVAVPEDEFCVTSFVFRVRNLPAALYKALGGFATNGINMTKLESYMQGGSFTATQFYADVEAHPEEPRMRRAMEELAFYADVQVLGTYAGDASRRV